MKKYRVIVKITDAEAVWDFAEHNRMHLAYVSVNGATNQAFADVHEYIYECTAQEETMTLLSLKFPVIIAKETV